MLDLALSTVTVETFPIYDFTLAHTQSLIFRPHLNGTILDDINVRIEIVMLAIFTQILKSTIDYYQYYQYHQYYQHYQFNGQSLLKCLHKLVKGGSHDVTEVSESPGYRYSGCDYVTLCCRGPQVREIC